MPEKKADEPKGTCYVVMGFGKKTDFETGRTLDLDKTYRNVIKPAVRAAGLECVRADEIVHSGSIDVPMYNQLLNADVVIADLSTSNRNAYYELGIRHALKPYTTIVISEDGAKTFPFDVNHDLNHVTVHQYHHMGDGIDFDEVERFRNALSNVITETFAKSPRPSDSPVYTFLENLKPPTLPEGAQAAETTAAKPVAEGGGEAGDESHSLLMQQAEKAQREGDFMTAKSLLTAVRGMMKAAAPDRPEDPYIIQRLASVTYKSKSPTAVEALREARHLLRTLDPATSNDPETLGLWGAVHKRLCDETKEPEFLDEAVRAYDRAFYLRNDYYNGINLAFLLNVRADVSVRATEARTRVETIALRANAVADFVQAERFRREVIAICESVLEKGELAEEDKYWVLATLAEAYLGIGDIENSRLKYSEAFFVASKNGMQKSTREQLNKLEALLADSPLKYVEPAAVA